MMNICAVAGLRSAAWLSIRAAPMLDRCQGLGVHKIVGQIHFAEFIAPHLHRIVDHFLLGAAAIFLQYLAAVGIGKNRFDPRRHVAGIETYGTGRRDAGQQCVANAMSLPPVAARASRSASSLASDPELTKKHTDSLSGSFDTIFCANAFCAGCR